MIKDESVRPLAVVFVVAVPVLVPVGMEMRRVSPPEYKRDLVWGCGIIWPP